MHAQGDLVVALGAATSELRDRRSEVAVALASQEHCSASGWCWELPAPSARAALTLLQDEGGARQGNAPCWLAYGIGEREAKT